MLFSTEVRVCVKKRDRLPLQWDNRLERIHRTSKGIGSEAEAEALQTNYRKRCAISGHFL